MQFTYLIFDMDGTLLDTHAGGLEAIRRGLSSFGLDNDTAAQTLLENWGGDVVGKLINHVAANTQQKLTHQEIGAQLVRHYNREVWERYVKPFPGIPSMLSLMKSLGFHLSIYSNCPDETVKKLSDYFLPNLFDLTIGWSEEVQKPDATILKRLFDQHEIDRGQVVMVGDTMTDLQTARNAGIAFRGVVWDDSPQVLELMKQNDELLFHTPRALLDHLVSA